MHKQRIYEGAIFSNQEASPADNDEIENVDRLTRPRQANNVTKESKNEILSRELRQAIHELVEGISESFIVGWYKLISETNDDFIVSCKNLIEDAMKKFAELCTSRLDRYKIGQLLVGLLRDHIINEKSEDKMKSIESQIDDHEYDICQSVVVRLFGLLSTDDLRRVIFTSFQFIPLKQDEKSQYHSNSILSIKNEVPSHFTSGLYTLVIAMLTKATLMPIIETISSPRWLYAVIIWLCEENKLNKTPQDQTPESSHGIKPGASTQDKINLGDENTTIDDKRSSLNLEFPNLITEGSLREIQSDDGIDMISSSINFASPVSDSLIRPMDNIQIYSTEEVKSSNLLHPDHDGHVIDKRGGRYTRTLDSNESRKLRTTKAVISSYRKSLRRNMTIKRRFREFVILQLRLEENPKIRPYMKNIPKPTKLKAATQNIFSLPGITNIKLDQTTIKLRQRFLERFLLALNNCPFIANSYEFREFFSYNLNRNPTQITKSKSLILQVNLNKVFVGSVRGALGILEGLLPGEDHRLKSGSEHDPDAWLTELQQSTMKLHIQTRTSPSRMALERYLDSSSLMNPEKSTKIIKSSSLNRHMIFERSGSVQYSRLRGGSLRDISNCQKSFNHDFYETKHSSSSSDSDDSRDISRSSSLESVYYDAPSDSHQSNQNESNSVQICDNLPIASKILDILHYSLLGNTKSSNSSIGYLAKFMLGKTIERLAAKTLSSINQEVAATCINSITKALWSESDVKLNLEEACPDKATQLVSNYLENNSNINFVPKQISHSLIKNQTSFYLSQLSSHKRNKFVIYSFLVNLLDELEPVEQ